MAKTGEKTTQDRTKFDAEKLTKHVCAITGQRIKLGDLYPVKDGLTGRMIYYSKKAFDAAQKA
ncbi:MAG TPA: hypothetical protein VJG32_23790 [Anaerolineae bacterium]|nr:hypothetical protein [Anaerolineae bacterium]